MTQSLKILLIDDDEIDRMSVVRACRKSSAPIEFTEADSARKGISLLESQSFDCVLLDFQLGEFNGLQVLQQFQEQKLNKIPVIMLSGLSDNKLILKCLEHGAQDFIQKSEMNADKLLRSINYAKERKRTEERLRFTAEHDHLTGLANRASFMLSVNRAITRAARDKKYMALLFIDLDNFKSINDTMGHNAGDELLITVSQRLTQTVRQCDFVSRLGGDEFIILLEDIKNEHDTIKVAEKILEALNHPIKLQGSAVYVTPSIGIATHPDCGLQAQDLLRNADIAMYRAKKEGRNCFRFYSDKLPETIENYDCLKKELIHALDQNEFELFYQPIIDIDGEFSKLEALLRWKHPTRGLILPEEFISVAELSDLIIPIENWMLKTAFQQFIHYKKCSRQKNTRFTLAINLSLQHIRNPNFLSHLDKTIKDASIDPQYIEFCLSEKALMDGIEHFLTTLRILREYGVSLTIDHFGNGTTSLVRLYDLPVQTVKIHQRFIKDIITDTRCATITKGIIKIANIFGLEVAACNINTEEQERILNHYGCDFYQGDFYNEPLPYNKLMQLIESEQCNFQLSSL